MGKKEYIDRVRYVGIKDMTGASLSPFEAFLIARGLKTLEIRMEKHCSNAQKVAEFLEKHASVETVLFPGLASFPQFALAKKQMLLPGAIISFEVKGGVEAGKELLNNLQLLSISVSLGGCRNPYSASRQHDPLLLFTRRTVCRQHKRRTYPPVCRIGEFRRYHCRP